MNTIATLRLDNVAHIALSLEQLDDPAIQDPDHDAIGVWLVGAVHLLTRAVADGNESAAPTLASILHRAVTAGVLLDGGLQAEVLALALDDDGSILAFDFAWELVRSMTGGIETPRAQWAWGRCAYELLDQHRIRQGLDADIIDEQLDALASCADSLHRDAPSVSSMADWVIEEMSSVLDGISNLADVADGLPDDWLGGAISVCDRLLGTCPAQRLVPLLAQMSSIAARCGPASERMRFAGEPSPFRVDVEYLLEMFGPCSEWDMG